MQRLCHQHTCQVSSVFLLAATCLWSLPSPVRSESPAYNYPTQARVEYVNECIANHGDSLASMYQCSCVIDRMASHLSYDDFVAAATFAKYSGLPGEGGAIFRDSEEAHRMAKLYRELEADAYRVCGLAKSPGKTSGKPPEKPAEKK